MSPRSLQTAQGEDLTAWASEGLKSEGINEVIVFLRQAYAGTVSFYESLLVLIAYLYESITRESSVYTHLVS